MLCFHFQLTLNVLNFLCDYYFNQRSYLEVYCFISQLLRGLPYIFPAMIFRKCGLHLHLQKLQSFYVPCCEPSHSMLSKCIKILAEFILLSWMLTSSSSIICLTDVPIFLKVFVFLKLGAGWYTRKVTIFQMISWFYTGNTSFSQLSYIQSSRRQSQCHRF